MSGTLKSAVFALAIAMMGVFVASGDEVATYSQRLTRPLLPKTQKFPVQDAVFAAFDAADRAADAAWGRLGSRAEYEAYRTKQRQGFIDAMGGFDLPRTPLNAKVTEKIARDGYRIEKILFESRPGVYVTGLLFLPDAAKFKPPYRAYIVPCGHTREGKGSPGYQRGGVMGALAGFAVFIYDPFAQGERMQPPSGGGCGGHNHYGALAELLGTSAARQRIWDGMRALDYLESRADIRKDGFGSMGNSGGGTETALMEVADPRIVAACPSCWISTLRDTCRTCGPQDAEQLTFGQLAFGFNHASYVLSGGNAVRVHCNFEDFFPYSGTCETMAVVTNVAARCGLDVTRYGMTDVTGPHAWKESSRTSSVQWMRRWLAGDESTPPIDVAACRKLDEKYPKGYGESTKGLAFDCGLPVQQALVTPQGQVSKVPGFRSIFEYLKDDLKVAETARPKRTRAELAKVVAARAGIRPLDAIGHTVREVAREKLANGVTVVSEVFTFADGIPVPAVTFLPAGAAKGAVLVTDDRHRGIHPFRVREEMNAGRAIMVVDLAATGETGRMKHRFYNMNNADEETAMMLYVLGKSLVGVRAEETLVMADHLKTMTGHPAEVVACGRTVISSAHAFAVRPDLFVKVLPFLCPQSWATSVRTSAVVPFANVVHGALKDYDWLDLLMVPNAPGTGVTETSIQEQIDAMAAKGGGTVVVPAGEWVTKPIALKSNITLQLEDGAVLLGSTDLADYACAETPGVSRALVSAVDVENVAIVGKGRIDGRGHCFKGKFVDPAAQPKVTPRMMKFVRCRNLRLEDFTYCRSASWAIHLVSSDGVEIRRRNQEGYGRYEDPGSRRRLSGIQHV